jgi:hypothetical protein
VSVDTAIIKLSSLKNIQVVLRNTGS